MLPRLFSCQSIESRRWLLSLVRVRLWFACWPRVIAPGHTIAGRSARSRCARATHSCSAGDPLLRYVFRADGEHGGVGRDRLSPGGDSHITVMRPRLNAIHMGTVGRELAGRSDAGPRGLPRLESCSHRAVARALRVTQWSRRGSMRVSEVRPPFTWVSLRPGWSVPGGSRSAPISSALSSNTHSIPPRHLAAIKK
jgi:hypothetical protein